MEKVKDWAAALAAIGAILGVMVGLTAVLGTPVGWTLVVLGGLALLLGFLADVKPVFYICGIANFVILLVLGVQSLIG